jgi:hypothetical protein
MYYIKPNSRNVWYYTLENGLEKATEASCVSSSSENWGLSARRVGLHDLDKNLHNHNFIGYVV